MLVSWMYFSYGGDALVKTGRKPLEVSDFVGQLAGIGQVSIPRGDACVSRSGGLAAPGLMLTTALTRCGVRTGRSSRSAARGSA